MAFRNGTNGDDTLTGVAGESNLLYGGYGDDTLVGAADATNRLYGEWDSGSSVLAFGDDVLYGGANATNYLYGDARAYAGAGGDDLLVAGANAVNHMYGDAFSANGACGDDTLVSGSGTDFMWGDAERLAFGTVRGRDTFVFEAGNNRDVIHDFTPGSDTIDIAALELMQYPDHLPVARLPARALAALQKTPLMKTGFDVLDSNGNGLLDDGDAFVGVAAGDTVIDLGAALGGAPGVDTITVIGQSALVQEDFVC